MIFGTHVVLFSHDAGSDRAFLGDVLGLPSVDAGGGWLIFALPPAEVAVHPVAPPEPGAPETSGRTRAPDTPDPPDPPDAAAPPGPALYLMCDDLDARLAALRARGVACSEVEEARWGRVSGFVLPGGTEIALYQPTHPTAVPPAPTRPAPPPPDRGPDDQRPAARRSGSDPPA